MRLSKERELAYIASGRIKLPAPKSVPVAQSKEHLNSSEAVEGSNPSGHTKRKPAHTPGRMNKTEQKYSWILEGLKRTGIVRRWEFQGIRLKLADGAWYRPDFLLWKCDDTMECIETKGGFIREAALVRYKVARGQYPIFRFRMLQYKEKTWSEIL